MGAAASFSKVPHLPGMLGESDAPAPNRLAKADRPAVERGGYASGDGGLEKDIAVAAAAAALCARCARRPSSSSRVGCSSTTPTNVLQHQCSPSVN